MTSTFQESTRESGEHSQNSRWHGAAKEMNGPQGTNYDANNCEVEEHSQDPSKQQWCELSEVVDSDILISPGDIYPNRKVELEDADIKEATKVSFDVLCEQQHEAFSKNNKDIGRTQLIEMEIDTGDSLLLHFGSTNPCRITRNVEQTKMYVCTLKNIYSSRCSHIAVHG